MRGRVAMDFYETSTGKHLVYIATTSGPKPWFTRDGREVWSSRGVSTEGWKIIKGGELDVIGLEPLGLNEGPSGGYPWESPHGHIVTDGGWILDSRRTRVMWLPHNWRINKRLRVWDGQFLGLLDGELPEPVILELDE